MSTADHRMLAKRTDRLVHVVNQLIADIESDIGAPAEAAFHAKAAHAALCKADLALRDAIAESTRGHYEAVAIAAANDGQISEALSSLHKKASQDERGHLCSGAATGDINGRKVSVSVAVGPSCRGSIGVHTDYTVDGKPVRVPDLISVIGGAA